MDNIKSIFKCDCGNDATLFSFEYNHVKATCADCGCSGPFCVVFGASKSKIQKDLEDLDES
jgi:hypothetical protein